MFCVVTSIQAPTESMRALAARLAESGSPLLLVGDAKGPEHYPLDRAELYSFEQQNRSEFRLAPELGANHYARKNLGYLLAISRGADSIYETDDDNSPLTTWCVRERETDVETVEARPWLNVYRLFAETNIWPRGFPLARVRQPATWAHEIGGSARVVAPIQQGLADGSPDVDAIWRMTLDAPIEFSQRASVHLPPSTWCPFNSQSTWWWPEAYALMYLPSTCSFRLTDIWRGFVAQRCLWELGHGLVFHAAEVFQERNEHDLVRDFEQERDGYTRHEELAHLLEDLSLEGPGNVGANLIACYRALVERGFLHADEMTRVTAWVEDLAALGHA